MATVNPTAIKRWIALEMRRLREVAGYDRAAAAERIGKAVTVVSHIESSRNLPAAADMELLLDFYGVPERIELFRKLLRSAKRGNDWWKNFSSIIDDRFSLYIGLESGAARLSSMHLNVLPGLLQTRDYASSIIKARHDNKSEEEIEARIDLRMARQSTVFDREDGDNLELWSIVDEGVLRRLIGGPEVMRDQLLHLVQLAERPNIDIQVLPFTAGAHPGTDGSFTILDYPSEFIGDPGTVYIEDQRQSKFYENDDSVRVFRRIFERLQVQAEKPTRSRDFIFNLTKEKH